jgi:hypothetical protein
VIWRELKPFASLVIVVAIYGIVRAVYLTISDGHGVLAPGGGVDTTLAVLALVTFILRLCVLVGVPFIAVYRLVMRLSSGRGYPPSCRSGSAPTPP